MLQDNALYKAMLIAVCQTFENMAFVEVTEQAEDFPLQMPGETAWVSILINDPVQGEIRLSIPQNLLVEMTANMFGIEREEVNENQKQDIIAELLNTLAGLFMTQLLPDDQTYKLGLPEHGEGPFPDIEDGSIVWNLQIEGSPFMLCASGAGLVAGKF